MVALSWLALDWNVVNDTVMGGVSSGRIQLDDTLTFTGALSLEQNGGFVSIRTRDADLDLDDVRALRLTLRGDARTWDFTLRRSDVPIRAGSYRVKVDVGPHPVEVEVPLSAFRPTSFGRPVVGAPALDTAPERIVSLGFLLADKRPGPFELEVLAIEPVRGASEPGPGRDEVVATLGRALDQGVPAFNRGDPARCRDLYVEALSSMAAHPALTAGEQALVAEALARVADQGATEGAWTARHAIDSVLAATLGG